MRVVYCCPLIFLVRCSSVVGWLMLVGRCLWFVVCWLWFVGLCVVCLLCVGRFVLVVCCVSFVVCCVVFLVRCLLLVARCLLFFYGCSLVLCGHRCCLLFVVRF